MPYRKQVRFEPIPGYRLLEPLGLGGYGEVWKCEAPGGLFKAIKFVEGPIGELDEDGAPAEEERQSIERIKCIRHPFLLSIDRVEVVQGELVLVTELADCNLHDLWHQYHQADQPGIPRQRLLAYLREAAEVLDLLNQQYQLQHLDIKPRNLFLVSNHVKVGDFGLVSSLSASSSAAQVGAITPLYASPEVFGGRISRHSDQYSLAIVYQELLTGTLPFQGKNSRQLLLLHTSTEPELKALPETDQPIIARALAKDPEKRFASCSDLVEALQAAGGLSAPTFRDIALPPVKPTRNNRERDTDSDMGMTARSGVFAGKTNPPVARGVLSRFQFLECHGSSPFMDVWQVEDPAGRQHLLKLIYPAGCAPRRFEETLQRLQSLQHPALVRLQVLEAAPGRVVVLTDLVERSLRDLLVYHQQRGQSGIPRLELLELLRPIAEALDYLYRQHLVQHLGLNPRSLLLDEGGLRVGDFGLVQLIWLPSGQKISALNRRYAAPELLQNQISPTCDQFSLALLYAEMLTGVLPTRGADGQFALEHLPPAERAILARALSATPSQRWPSCAELLRALELGDSSNPVSASVPDALTEVVGSSGVRRALQQSASKESVLALGEMLACVLGQAVQDQRILLEPSAPELAPDGKSLLYRFSAGVPLGAARLKLDTIREQWSGQLTRDDEQGYIFRVPLPATFWGQWFGRQPALEVSVVLARHHPLAATPITVTVTITTFCCTQRQARKLLEDVGRSLLDTLRTVMLVGGEKRLQERVLWPHGLEVVPVGDQGTPETALSCRGKDLSLTGIGFYLPQPLDTSEVLVRLPGLQQGQTIQLPATLVRATRCADGWYDVGALFQLTSLQPSAVEEDHSKAETRTRLRRKKKANRQDARGE